MRAVAVIPARMGSNRFPGKVISLVDGEPLVVHVWRRLKTARTLDAVYVATADDAVAEVIQAAGGEVLRTVGEHRCGTDRVAEAIQDIDADIVVNVQADCARLEPSVVDQVVDRLKEPGCAVVTPVSPLTDVNDVERADCVKAVLGHEGRAIYFSRSVVPHEGPWLRHVGIYGFRRAALMAFADLQPSRLEQSEGLEQLRLIENDLPIHTIMVDAPGVSVDTPSDLRRLNTLSPTQLRGSHA
jgi:3-deoxy-D-manno-octulosonate cytidylyltransferase